jgi:hypothetical protein
MDPVHIGAMAYTGLVTSAFAVVVESVALSYVPVEVTHTHTHPSSQPSIVSDPISCLLGCGCVCDVGTAGDDRHPQVSALFTSPMSHALHRCFVQSSDALLLPYSLFFVT